MKFDKKEYDINYIKNNRKKFAVDLNLEEYDNITNLLKKFNIRKSDFMRDAIENFKEDLKYKRYFINTMDELYVKKENNWCYEYLVDNEYTEVYSIKMYDNYDVALNEYNKIKLNGEVVKNNKYCRIKELYCFDIRKITNDQFIEKEFDFNSDDCKMILSDVFED